ncbi:MAG TPA: hypothetical protein VMA73_20575 [Streptosporangiaceae bacterium]|nr:hypothetical protein [Streptosporangiaceae bacterium]
MKRHPRLPVGLIWLVTVLSSWLLTTALLAVLISTGSADAATGALLSQSMTSAAFACVVVGGPATAIGLRVRRSSGLGKAALSGLATAALIMLFLWSYLEASGTSITGEWSAVTPVFVVAVIELALAFALRGRRVGVADEPEPSAD